MRSTTSVFDVFRFVGRYWSKNPAMLGAVLLGLTTSVVIEVQIPARASDLVAALQAWTVERGSASPARMAAWMLLATFAALSLSQQFYQRVYIHFTADVMRRLVNDGFARVQRFGTDWHTNHFAGATVRKLTRGMWAYDSFADVVIVNLGPGLVLLAAFSVAMAQKDIWLGLYFAGAVSLFLSVSVAASLLYVAPSNRAANRADTDMGAALADAVTCNSAVKGFGAEAFEEERLGAVSLEWMTASRRAWRRSMDNGALQSMLLVGLLGGLVWYVFARASSGKVDELVYVLTSYFVVNGYLRNVGWQVRALQRSVNELDDLIGFAQRALDVPDREGAKHFTHGRGEIRFEGVGFGYPNQGRAVFEDLSLTIAPGEKMALVGPSGAGKTTFVKLLQRLYDVGEGRILVDGQDIRDVTQSSLRQAFAIVPQEPILFHRSLAENIAYGRPDAEPSAIERAARRAHAASFIEKLPRRYETLVGERGVKLSGGERQRVALARAILADAPFLILDEATSSLDSETEVLIQDAVDQVLRNRTAVLIAHRLSTVRKADRILVFEKGRIVEEGDHETLMARGGTYRRLHDLQAFADAHEATTPRPVSRVR
ncbi:MAG: ABC transporter ATP-binding protein [Myxococcota bacterium]